MTRDAAWRTARMEEEAEALEALAGVELTTLGPLVLAARRKALTYCAAAVERNRELVDAIDAVEDQREEERHRRALDAYEARRQAADLASTARYAVERVEELILDRPRMTVPELIAILRQDMFDAEEAHLAAKALAHKGGRP